MKKYVALFWIVPGLCVVTCLVYLLALRVDRKICFEKLSESLDVPPTTSEIWMALNNELSTSFPLGMTHTDVLSGLSKLDYKIKWRRADLGGGYKEYIILDNCNFSQNNFSFLFIFSKEETLTGIRNYIDD